MPKTITIRIDDNVYEVFKKAADGERRSISNFIECAALAYLTNDINVSDEEMDGILSDKALVGSIEKGLKNIREGKYKFID